MMNLIKKEKGFTLIELMIVVAIIGILAAIAIPQFSTYRTKAFNAAAISDLHTARLAEESIYADYQKYGSSINKTATAGTAAGTKLIANGWIATDGNSSSSVEQAAISLSKNVQLRALMLDKTFDYATITAKHVNGDKSYVSETDQSGTYQKGVATTASLSPVAATAVLDATTKNGYSSM